MQELCNFRRVLEAQTDQGKDADIGGQTVFFFRPDTHLGLQQGIEIIDEIGEKMQEDGVEVLIKFFKFLLLQLCRLGNLVSVSAVTPCRL